ncbi:MAG: heparan-alpha-glucosaminide N-acetyltransferase domain-containing protein, partial [Halieaceae bacterium]
MSELAGKDARTYRLSSIDFLRGLVIVVMAIDHVRDFFLSGATLNTLGDPDTSLGVYVTRWITHFCAPVFIFLAGTSAGLRAARKTPGDLGLFLFKRGMWLIFVEVVVISTAWTFAPMGMAQIGGATLVGLQVIWAIGVSMAMLAFAQLLG